VKQAKSPETSRQKLVIVSPFALQLFSWQGLH